MAVGDENLVSVVRGLASSNPDVREGASETVCDWLKSFDRREVRLLSALLSFLVVLETEPDCCESELNALGGLTETGFVQQDEEGVMTHESGSRAGQDTTTYGSSSIRGEPGAATPGCKPPNRLRQY
ncbi:hypothetical protein ACF07T_08915 [Streptomyces sp. NPDC015184]|uniref:hypothetical protein n=1 Tax=Streptomyces sp. NPDC015184 TaxID=3364946 RepID=UPI0036FDC14C